MKNLIFAMVLLLSVSTYGQGTKKFNYQLNAGSTLSIPYNKLISNNYGRYQKSYCNAGFFAEGHLIYNITNRYSLLTGINYEYNNLRINSVLGAETLKVTIYSQRINLPVEFRCKVLALKPIYICAGGYIGTGISKKERGTRYIDFSMLHEIDPNDPLLNSTQIQESPYSRDYHNGFTLTYGLSARIEYILKMNDKTGMVVFSGCSYGWSNSTENNFKTEKDLNFLAKLGVGINI